MRDTVNITKTMRQLCNETRVTPRPDYAAATPSTFRRTRTGLHGDADAHLISDNRYFTMIEYVRDMDRNDFMVGQIVDRLVDNVIRNGAVLEPQTGSRALDAALFEDDEQWANDADNFDTSGRYTRGELERLAYRHRIVDGDCVITGTQEGSLQWFEADRLRTPNSSARNIVHGVELDSRKRKIRYYFTKDDAQIMPRLRRVAKVSDTIPVSAYDEDGSPQVFHQMKASRFSLTRGITAFHAVFDLNGQADDLMFAGVVRHQVVAAQAFAIESPESATNTDTKMGERSGEQTASGFERTLEKIAAGAIIRLKPGQKISLLGPSIGTPDLIQHLKFIIQAIGCVVNMPLVLISLDASETNFSGWRGAIDQARESFKCEQTHCYRQLNRPTYLWRLRRRMQDDDALGKMLRRHAELKGVRRAFQHEWHGPRWSYIQPLQDAQANALRLQTAQVSPRRFHAEIGSDWETYVREQVNDNARLVAAAINAFAKLKAKFGNDVHDLTWRDLAHRDFYRGGQLIDTADADLEKRDSAKTVQPAQ